ncbi:hypothetical protein B296_00000312 [Ensete ventricosum]|uniref:Uncharacterized protein n=1 Tax=Ensete ventricosum TaxID=4639 RepID=A0A427AP38_ENSVE|nr:hypothetical protein B296_00000312 [Ensete ventricosum]
MMIAPGFISGRLKVLAQRPRQGGGARCDPSDDQINAPIEMVSEVQYVEKVSERGRVRERDQASVLDLHLHLLVSCVGFTLLLHQIGHACARSAVTVPGWPRLRQIG